MLQHRVGVVTLRHRKQSRLCAASRSQTVTLARRYGSGRWGRFPQPLSFTCRLSGIARIPTFETRGEPPVTYPRKSEQGLRGSGAGARSSMPEFRAPGPGPRSAPSPLPRRQRRPPPVRGRVVRRRCRRGVRCQQVQGDPDRVVQYRVPALRPVQGVRSASRSGSTPWFSTDQPYVSNQAAFIGTVITVPSPRRWRPVMPTTPPHVRWPTTGPSFSRRNAAVIMSPSEDVASSARATTGPRGRWRRTRRAGRPG